MRPSFAPTAQTSAPGRSHSPRSTGSGEAVTVTTMSHSAGSRWLSPGSAPVRSQKSRSALRRAAVGDRPLERRHGGADAGELRLRLPAAADQPDARCAAAREMPRGDPARGAGAQLAELVRVDHGDELRRVGAEEQHLEARAGAEAGVDLRARVAELEVGRGHHRERALLEPEPVAGPVLDRARRHAAGSTPRRHSTASAGESSCCDVGLGEVQGHAAYSRRLGDRQAARRLTPPGTPPPHGPLWIAG